MHRSLRPALSALALALLLAAGTAAARPAIVAHAGVASANLHCDPLTSDAREGLAVGAGVDLPLGGQWHLTPELWYVSKGFQGGTLWEILILEMKADVVSVPVLLSYHFPAERVDPRAFVGLATDVLVKAETRREGRGWVDVLDETDTFSWTLVVGGGVRKGRWDAEVRYLQGLTAVTDFDYGDFDDMISEYRKFKDATDTTWVLSLGVWF
ncbi:MAG: porin family protein [Candidatus Krumholzibacteriia bacterium]